PEVGRPMVQRMIPEQAGQAQFAALELSRRAEELGRLRDLAPPALVSEPAPAVPDREPREEPAKEPAPAAVSGEHPNEPAPLAAPAAPAAAAVVVAAVAPPPVPQADDSGKAPADTPPADSRDTAATAVDAIEAVLNPGADATGSRAAAMPEDTV